jgi:hypothetical protein
MKCESLRSSTANPLPLLNIRIEASEKAMVATLILHSRGDLDWATALAAELSEHAPVRLQLSTAPPKAKIGPSVVRIALWSENAARDGITGTLSSLLQAAPAHSILVRREGYQPPPGIDPASLAGHTESATARDAVAALKAAIPRVGNQVQEIVRAARVRVETAQARQLRLADTALLALILTAVATAALWQDWAGLRSLAVRLLGAGTA